MRGVSRKAIRTRSGISEIRIERGRLNRREVEDNLPPVEVFGNSEPLPPSLADDVARQLRDRITFPPGFYKGASE